MSMTKTNKIKALEVMANKLRIHSLKSTTTAGSGHPTSCLSAAELMSCLFFSELEKEDEFVLSKGHAAPILWACYAEAGLFPPSELLNLRKFTSPLEGHPTSLMPYVKVATGSLGQGLSAGLGMALGKRLLKKKGNVFVLLGDGECAEGAIWEAANLATYYKLNNLCAIIDVNRLGQSQETKHGHDLEIYARKFSAFGWEARTIDGHNVKQIISALKQSRRSRKPFVIIAKTIKGKGVSFLEDKNGWHGKALTVEEFEKALKELPSISEKFSLSSKINKSLPRQKVKIRPFQPTRYALGEMVATREAYGRALVKLGEKNQAVVVLDGDVKNSTRTEYFFERFPKRAFEFFIAEQNMVGAAVGLQTQGFIPFVATFSCFLSRAHDFIRMAQYSRA
ncbi:MAG: transketolase, partial [Candidatus Woesearchaeota archaeon]